LFDTINDPATNDDEWTPKELTLDIQKYHQKLENLSRVLLEIDLQKTPFTHFYRLFRNRKSWCSRGFNQAA
jgi:hypothetical protein